MTPDRRRKRREDVRGRAARKDPMYSRCRMIGCGKPTTAATNSGLNRMYCRSHEDHHERHGSYLKGSYSAAALRPHRAGAAVWLREHAHRPEVMLAIKGVERLYRNAGPMVEAFRLRGKTPAERASAVWARLREAQVAPQVPLEVWLAVGRTIDADLQPDRHTEYKHVQVAKLLHRIAGGSHRRWERTSTSGRRIVEEIHSHPASRGRVLRHIGAQLQKAAELLGPLDVREVFPVPPPPPLALPF